MNMRILSVLILLLVGSVQTACNTTKGFGRDVEAAGDAIEDKADDVQDDDD